MATSTIGTDGRDFSTATLWEASPPASGDIGEAYNDSAFDEDIVIDATTNLTLTVAAGERHDGTAGTGVRNVVSADGRGFQLNNTGLRLEWWEWDGSETYNRSQGAIQIAADADNFVVGQCIAHDMGDTGVPKIFRANVAIGDLFNCIFYDGIYTRGAGSSPDAGWVAIEAGAGANVNVHNITVHDFINNGSGASSFGIGWPDTATFPETIQNCIVTDIGGSVATVQDYQHSAPSFGTIDHNLSSDTTASGTGSLTEKAAADQFVSITGGSEDLHLKSGADAIDAGTDLGTTPTGVNIDIDGRDRDAEGDTWDIGADEFVAAAGGVSLEVPQTDLVLDGKAPAVDVGLALIVPQADLALDGKAPTVATDLSLTVPQADVILDGKAPSVLTPKAFEVPQGDLVLDGKTPVLAITIQRNVPQADLVLDGKAPSVLTPQNFSVPQSDLVLDGKAPTLSVSSGVSLEIPQADLTLDGKAPSVNFAFTLQPGQVDLVIDGKAPSLVVDIQRGVPQADIALDGKAPSLLQNIIRLIPQGNIVLDGKAPSVSTPQTFSIPQADLVLDGKVPTLGLLTPVSISVPQADLTLDTSVPTLAIAALFSGLTTDGLKRRIRPLKDARTVSPLR